MQNNKRVGILRILELQPCGRYKFLDGCNNQLDLSYGEELNSMFYTGFSSVLHPVRMTDELYNKIACKGSTRNRILLFNEFPTISGYPVEGSYPYKIYSLINSANHNTYSIEENCKHNLKTAGLYKKYARRWNYFFNKSPSSRLFSIKGIFSGFPAPATVYLTS